MITGTALHLITGFFSTVFGFLLSLVPSVPGWLTGSSPQIQAFFASAAGLDAWIPVSDAMGVVQLVLGIWAGAVLLAFVRGAFTSAMNWRG